MWLTMTSPPEQMEWSCKYHDNRIARGTRFFSQRTQTRINATIRGGPATHVHRGRGGKVSSERVLFPLRRPPGWRFAHSKESLVVGARGRNSGTGCEPGHAAGSSSRGGQRALAGIQAGDQPAFWRRRLRYLRLRYLCCRIARSIYIGCDSRDPRATVMKTLNRIPTSSPFIFTPNWKVKGGLLCEKPTGGL
jgi:hypothetical protein